MILWQLILGVYIGFKVYKKLSENKSEESDKSSEDAFRPPPVRVSPATEPYRAEGESRDPAQVDT